MFPRALFFLFFFSLLIFLIFFYLKEHFPSISPSNNCTSNNCTSNTCICAFDLDNTITCGIDRAAEAIKTCKNLNCKIAFNTARTAKWHSDLDLNGLGLDPQDLDNDFYHGEEYRCSFSDRKCFEDTIAETKVKHLWTLSRKWNIKPSKIILFDDQISNIDRAKAEGFATILANHHHCGLPHGTKELIENIVNS